MALYKCSIAIRGSSEELARVNMNDVDVSEMNEVVHIMYRGKF